MCPSLNVKSRSIHGIAIVMIFVGLGNGLYALYIIDGGFIFSNFGLFFRFMLYLIPDFGWEFSYVQIYWFSSWINATKVFNIVVLVHFLLLGLGMGLIIGNYLTLKLQKLTDSSSRLRILIGTVGGLAVASVLLFLYDVYVLNDACNLLITNGPLFHLTRNWMFGVWFLNFSNIPQISSILLIFITILLGSSTGLIIGTYYLKITKKRMTT